jgi:hypothetical protein
VGGADEEEVVNAIPTKYAGTQFRSRLEARWAAFFDLLAWQWEYEPIDLAGYIPDFIVRIPVQSYDGVAGLREPLLVEVKPFVHWPCAVLGCTTCPPSHGSNAVDSDARSMMDAAIRKIQQSGWTKEAVIVGATMTPAGKHGIPGFGSPVDVVPGEALWFETDTIVTQCMTCGTYLAQPNVEDWGYSHCGKYAEPINPTPLWREAGNRVQWRGVETRR